ncbi:hypothetical protein V8E53_003016 [Lactarius tabidus]
MLTLTQTTPLVTVATVILKGIVGDSDSEDDSENTLKSLDEHVENRHEEDLINLDNEALRQSLRNEAVGWDDDQPSRPSQSQRLQVRHCDHAASNNANTSDDDSDNINNNTMDVNRGDGAVPGSDDDDDDRLSAHADETRGPLTKHAAQRQAEVITLSDDDEDNEDDMSRFGVPSAHERNIHWPRAPVCPPGSRQRNICINMQPEDFKAILKAGIRSLTCSCAFKRGYIPVDLQTEYFVQLVITSAVNLNKPQYAVRLQKDSILQKEISDLFNARVSLYRTMVKRAAFNLVTHGYGLSEDQTAQAMQVKDLIHNDRFIFEPKDGGINTAKPFQHTAVVGTLREAFFKSRRGASFAQKNRQWFPKIESGPKVGELMLPSAMVAMAAVAVCHVSFLQAYFTHISHRFTLLLKRKQ